MTMKVDGERHHPSPIFHLVQSHIPGTTFVRSAAAELALRLPLESTSLFADMLDHLEEEKDSLGLGYYSISMPSLVWSPLDSRSLPKLNGLAHDRWSQLRRDREGWELFVLPIYFLP